MGAITVFDLTGQNDPSLGVASLCAKIKKAKYECDLVKLRLGEKLPDIVGEGIILTGGPGSPYEPSEWSSQLGDALPAWKSRWVLGICLGFQVMAVQQQWRVAELPTARRGLFDLCRTTVGKKHWLLRDASSEASCFEWREWSVGSPDADCVLAGDLSNDCLAAKFRPRWYGVSFHPEAEPAAVAEFLASTPAYSPHLGHAQDNQIALRVDSLRTVYETVVESFLSRAHLIDGLD